MDTICRKGQSRLYFLRKLGSFDICRKLLQMFYLQSVVASVLFYAVVCWGGSSKKRDAARLDRLRKVGSVVRAELDSLVMVTERKTLKRKPSWTTPTIPCIALSLDVEVCSVGDCCHNPVPQTDSGTLLSPWPCVCTTAHGHGRGKAHSDSGLISPFHSTSAQLTLE